MLLFQVSERNIIWTTVANGLYCTKYTNKIKKKKFWFQLYKIVSSFYCVWRNIFFGNFSLPFLDKLNSFSFLTWHLCIRVYHTIESWQLREDSSLDFPGQASEDIIIVSCNSRAFHSPVPLIFLRTKTTSNCSFNSELTFKMKLHFLKFHKKNCYSFFFHIFGEKNLQKCCNTISKH